MLKLIISASSNPGDIDMDCFAGSGTTLGAAFELGRRWIGADSSIESIKAILKRFTVGLDIYGDYVSTTTDRQCTMDIFPKCTFELISDESYFDELNQLFCND